MRRPSILTFALAVTVGCLPAGASAFALPARVCQTVDVSGPRYGAHLRPIPATYNPGGIEQAPWGWPITVFGPVERDEGGRRSVGRSVEIWFVRGRDAAYPTRRSRLVAAEDVAGQC